VKLDRAKGEHRAPAYLAINPGGKVPGLVDSGQRYFESVAIILHLGEAYGRPRGLWPASGPLHAEALCWTVWGSTELQAYMMQFLYHGLDTPVSYAREARSQATAEYNHSQFLRALDALDGHLAGRDHVLGDFSLADIPAAASLLFGIGLGVNLEGRAHVERWLDRCRARPARARVDP
jgi:glutathione S-transferase